MNGTGEQESRPTPASIEPSTGWKPVPHSDTGREPVPHAPHRLRRWPSVVMVLLIFLGGAACGAALATMAAKHMMHHSMGDAHAVLDHITQHLSELLHLTPEQSRQVREILVRRHNALIDIRRDIQPRLEVELTVLDNEIAGVLTEEQRPKWRAHAADMRAHWLPPIPER